jgi:hypothetical protein
MVDVVSMAAMIYQRSMGCKGLKAILAGTVLCSSYSGWLVSAGFFFGFSV